MKIRLLDCTLFRVALYLRVSVSDRADKARDPKFYFRCSSKVRLSYLGWCQRLSRSFKILLFSFVTPHLQPLSLTILHFSF